VVRSENKSPEAATPGDTPRLSSEAPCPPTAAGTAAVNEESRENASGVAPRPRAPSRPLRWVTLGYGDFCLYCRHSAPFHRGMGECRLRGCGCPRFMLQRPNRSNGRRR